jgi:choline kinase
MKQAGPAAGEGQRLRPLRNDPGCIYIAGKPIISMFSNTGEQWYPASLVVGYKREQVLILSEIVKIQC